MRTIIPWTIHYLIIRKYFRRNTKKLSTSRSKFILLSNQFPKLSRRRTETDLSTIRSTINERQNPCTSYFYIPSFSHLNFSHNNQKVQ
jgi:hypothetical protein